MTRSSLLLFVCLALPSTVLASPETVASDLHAGRLTPQEAAQAWTRSGTSTQAALELLQRVPRTAVNGTRTKQVTLKDPHGRESRIEIRFPASAAPDGRYGVLIMLHGLGGNARQLLFFGRRIAPKHTIVVAPNAQKLHREVENEDSFKLGITSRALRHWWSYSDWCFPLKALELLNKSYPIDTDRVFLAGYSMGGYGTWNIGLRHHDRFAAIVPMAGGISRLENFMARDDRSRQVLRNAVNVPSFFVHGDSDRMVPVRFSRTIAKELEGFGAPFVYEEVPGGPHILREFLKGDELSSKLTTWLAQRKRKASPRRVSHTVLGPYHGQAYWVRVDTIQGKSKHAQVTAEVQRGNRIKVATKHVQRLTIFLDPDLVDTGREVVVEVNGRVVHRDRVSSSLLTVAETWAARRDPQLSYSHQITLDLTSAPAAAAPRPKAKTKSAKKPSRWF